MHAIDLGSFLQVLSAASVKELSDMVEHAMALIEKHESGNPAHALSAESLQRCYAVLDAAAAS